MLMIRRWYNQNKNILWKYIGIVVFLILLLQVLNYFVGKNNSINNNLNTEVSIQKEYTDLSLKSDKSVLSNNKISTSKEKSINIINSFFDYCNEGNIEKAYELLTAECKEQLYPSLKEFKNNYYKIVFNGEKKNILLENWIEDIYKVEISNDILATGIYDERNIRQEYVTIKEENSAYKININNYIGTTELNKISESISNIQLIVEKKDEFMDYEIYTFKLNNKTDNTILLDNLKDMNSMYLLDTNDIKYSAYTHEISINELLIGPRETRQLKIKYYNKYSSGKKIDNIVFSKVITEYNHSIAQNDYYKFDDYNIIEIKI